MAAPWWWRGAHRGPASANLHRSGRDQLSTDYPLKRVRLVHGMRHRHSGLYLRFLGALMSQSTQKKMRMLHYSDHDGRVTAQI
jgi:hypothetical protein